MATRPGDRAPSAAPYPTLPAYSQARELHAVLRVTARRIGPSPFAVDRLLREKALRTVLDAAEAGARVGPARRGRFYRAGWFATHDLNGLLNTAQALGRFPPESRLAPDAALRMAQQALTIATGVMRRRASRPPPNPGG